MSLYLKYFIENKKNTISIVPMLYSLQNEDNILKAF